MVDVLHINDIPFLTLISNYLYYRITNTVDNIKALTLEARLKNIIRNYAI